MKHLSVALIVISLIAAALLNDAFGWDPGNSWGKAAGFAVLYAGFYFWWKD